MNKTITLIETVIGCQPGEQIDFLSFQSEGENINLAAYLKGDGHINVFTYKSFAEYFVLNQKDAIHQDIDHATYYSDLLLERFIKHHYFGIPLPKEELMFGFLGNGVFVCDRLRREHGDYMKIAHIEANRKVTYYNPVSDEGRTRIEKFAKEENITIESQRISALCPESKKAIQHESDQELLRSISCLLGRKRGYLNLHNEICNAFNGLRPGCEFDVEKLINSWYKNDCDCFLWFNSMSPNEREQLLTYYREHSLICS